MKNVFIFIFVLVLSVTGHANTTQKPISVYITHSASAVLGPMCHHLWKTYEEYFKESAVIIPAPGVDGIVATKTMLDSRAKDRLLCHGNSLWIQNRFAHAGTDSGLDQIQLVARIVGGTTVWFTPNRAPAIRTLTDLINYLKSLDRPVNIGVYTGAHRVMAQYIAKQYNIPVNVIDFKRGQDFYPVLVDGSLDLAFDAGGGVDVAKTGRFKIAGYSSVQPEPNLPEYTNFLTADRNLANFSLWLGISTPKNSDPEFVKKMQDRIEFIVKQESFRQFGNKLYSPEAFLKGAEAENFISQQIRSTGQLWKKIN